MSSTSPIAATAQADASKPKIGLILIVAAVVTGLVALDISLAQTEQIELQKSAWHSYQAGVDLLKRGQVDGAVDAFRRAHALERTNEQYELALVDGLMAANKLDEARSLLNEVLQDDSNDGRANLTSARLALRRHRLRAAESYYHRAIYGDWPTDATQNRIAVRMELIDLLQKQGNQEELLAELLPLEEDAGKDPNLQLKLAHLYLVAGSPERAANSYRAILQHNPDKTDAYAGLGEADMALGQYHAAHGNFLQAYYHDPKNQDFRAKAELAEQLANTPKPAQ